MNSILAFLILITGVLHLNSWQGSLEAKFNPPILEQNNTVLASDFDLKTFPLLDKTVKFNFRSKAGLVVDEKNDFIIWEKNKDKVLPIASLTKMMTAIVVMENRDPDETITISKTAAEIEGSSIGFLEGEKFKLKDLIKAMVIASANDGAQALKDDLGKKDFDVVAEMNKKAKNMGLEHTYYKDDIGLSDKNISTAWELYQIAKEFLKNDYLRQSAKETNAKIYAESKAEYEFWTTNRLLYSESNQFSGVKTGYTEEAGNCFVGLKYVDNKYPTIFVVLNAPDGFTRFDDPDVASQYMEWYGQY